MCRSQADGGRRCAYHSSPEYRDKENAHRRLQYAQAKQQPLTDVLYQRHLEFAYVTTEALNRDGDSTADLHSTVNEHGQRVWNDDRLETHSEILEHFMNRWEDVPREKQAVISGGLAGGGKTSTLENHAGIPFASFALLSPDEIKEIMAERGMFPTISGLTPMEASATGYVEAVHLTNLLLAKTTKEDFNIIYDTTMSFEPATIAKMQPMRDAGYEISAVFVDIEIETSLRRSQERHRKGLDAFLTQGIGFGGRLLPRGAVTNQRSDDPAVRSKNVTVFEALEKDNWFASSMLFDNNVDGRAPQRIR